MLSLSQPLLVRPVQVQDPAGQVIYDKRAQKQGQFAFTAKTSGDYKACFTTKGERWPGLTSKACAL